MRGIDANIVLRYFLQDVPDQSAKAVALITSEERLGITGVALAEIAWTLRRPRYGVERTRVATELIELLSR